MARQNWWASIIHPASPSSNTLRSTDPTKSDVGAKEASLNSDRTASEVANGDTPGVEKAQSHTASDGAEAVIHVKLGTKMDPAYYLQCCPVP
ncbi:hypothetical protein IAR50_003235 [Cryptococcus sp. DSM 104548]